MANEISCASLWTPLDIGNATVGDTLDNRHCQQSPSSKRIHISRWPFTRSLDNDGDDDVVVGRCRWLCLTLPREILHRMINSFSMLMLELVAHADIGTGGDHDGSWW